MALLRLAFALLYTFGLFVCIGALALAALAAAAAALFAFGRLGLLCYYALEPALPDVPKGTAQALCFAYPAVFAFVYLYAWANEAAPTPDAPTPDGPPAPPPAPRRSLAHAGLSLAGRTAGKVALHALAHAVKSQVADYRAAHGHKKHH